MKVSILNNGGKIRLKYIYKGKVQLISLGLDYNDHRDYQIAQDKANLILHDIKYNTYEGKDKYRINAKPKVTWNFPQILQFYLDYSNRDSSTIASVRHLLSWCDRSPARLLFPERLDEWINYLKNKIPRLDNRGTGYSNSTIFTDIKILQASINLAMQLEKIPPSKTIALACRSVRTKLKKEVKVYSKEDIRSIIDTFYDLPAHSYYADFVHFRFLTGCRPSEAVALTWDDLIEDQGKTYIKFNKRFVKGELKEGLKGKKSFRYFPCNKQLTNLLRSIAKHNSKLIFPSPHDVYIDTKNFSVRHWRIVIEYLIVQNILDFYISFYDIRHCFGTYACRESGDLKSISQVMGNSPSVLQKHYLESTLNIDLPSFYDD